jgi:cellulose synthase/poly-beta-1,6-N-acetylglucosamine synthase-like glycosyltransferase
MSEWLIGLAVVPTALLCIPSGVFVAETLAGCLRPARSVRQVHWQGLNAQPSVAVLVPAHNEAGGIIATIHSVQEQLRPGDRLLIVADNCSDATASVSRAAGAEVTERFHKQLRGKGFALDHGVRHLEASPPDMVLMLDADCVMAPGALEQLRQHCMAHGHPSQACYLMQNSGDSVKTHVAEFAWAVKNLVRPMGAARLGWPCQLTGSGMMFPWSVIQQAPLASGHLVEDMQLGAHLALRGQWPLFCDEARVTSTFPTSDQAIQSQRERWEHGHLSMIGTMGIPLLGMALKRRSWPLLGMALDISVPPLTSLVMALGVWALVTVCLAWALETAGAWWLVGASWGALGTVFLCIGLALRVRCAHILSMSDLLALPRYAFSKVHVYAGFFGRRQREWIRTKRDHES